MEGNWLSINGEAIYGTRPWKVCQNETSSSVFYTTKQQEHNGETLLYAIFTKWPTHNVLPLNCVTPTSNTKIYFLGLQDNDNIRTTVRSSLRYRPITTTDSNRSDTGPGTASTTATTTTDTARWKKHRYGQEMVSPNNDNMDTSATWKHNGRNTGIEVILPALTPDIIPCPHAWVIVLSHIQNV